MRDLKLITGDAFNLDIDIVDGYPVYLDFENNTQDQRAAVAAYQAKGTIPGMLNEGVDWGALYESQDTMIQIDNQIKQNIQNKAGGSGAFNTAYVPIYAQNPGKPISMCIYKEGVQS